MYLRLADAEDFDEMRGEETQLIWFTFEENNELSMAGLGEKWRLYYEKNTGGGKAHIRLDNLTETNHSVLTFNRNSNQIQCSQGKLEAFDYTPVLSISQTSTTTFLTEE